MTFFSAVFGSISISFGSSQCEGCDDWSVIHSWTQQWIHSRSRGLFRQQRKVQDLHSRQTARRCSDKPFAAHDGPACCSRHRGYIGDIFQVDRKLSHRCRSRHCRCDHWLRYRQHTMAKIESYQQKKLVFFRVLFCLFTFLATLKCGYSTFPLYSGATFATLFAMIVAIRRKKTRPMTGEFSIFSLTTIPSSLETWNTLLRT